MNMGIANFRKELALCGADDSRPRWVGTRQVSDRDLLDRIVDADKLAMQIFFARHHVAIYRFVLRILGDKMLAEDIVSEVFIAVWRHSAQFEGRSTVSTWVFSIARFKALTALHDRARDDALDEDEAAAIRDTADDPETAVQKKDRAAILRQCMNQLSRDHRKIIDLVYYHEKSVDEVARIIGVPKGTVKTRMFHARRQMLSLLTQAGIDQTCQ